MKRNACPTGRLVVALLALGGPALVAAGRTDPVCCRPVEAGITAKAGLAAAKAQAEKWQPDAVLTYVETSTALPNGKAYSWLYVFLSPKTKEQTGVIVDDKGEAGRLPAQSIYKDPVGEFSDSDRAMAEAVKNGLKTHEWGMKGSLSKGDRVEWRFLDNDYFYYVDAANGVFLRKEKTD